MNLQDITNNLSPQEIAKLFRSEPSLWRTESLSGSLALLGAGALIGDQLQGQQQTQYQQQQQIDQNQTELQRQRQQIDQLRRRQEY